MKHLSPLPQHQCLLLSTASSISVTESFITFLAGLDTINIVNMNAKVEHIAAILFLAQWAVTLAALVAYGGFKLCTRRKREVGHV